ncbi:MAG TPA: hypothetical protein VKS78_00170 [Roseiarcus sp.]|nr:hypothetical protein [Roseiarcus sp.]
MTASGELAAGARVAADVEWRRRLKAASLALSPALAVLAVAVLLQARGSLTDDISWLITLSEKTLDGQRPYVDFIEVNPPASIFLYVPAVAMARLLAVSPEFMVSLFCFLAIGASLALCAGALRHTAAFKKAGPLGLASAVAVLAILPAHEFAQREHLAIIAGLPLFAALAARASGAEVGVGLRTLAALGAGVMVAIKPHFALMIVATLPYFAWRVGWRSLVASLELYVVAAVCALYLTAIVVFFPEYIEKIAPLVVAVYVPARDPLLVLAEGVAVKVWCLFAGFLLVTARRKIGDPLIATLALASCGALLVYLAQGKGWPYQSYPAIGLMALALGLALSSDRRDVRQLVASVGIFILLIAATLIDLVVINYLFFFALPLGVAAIALQALGALSPRWRPVIASLSELALAGVCAMAYLWFMEIHGASLWLLHLYPPSPLEQAAATLKPHPTVLSITQRLEVGPPFARRIGGVWAQRVGALWLTSGARRIIADSGDDPAVIARMQPYLRLDRDMLIDDINRNRPDIVVISNRYGEYRNWAFADPLIAAALADYQLYASDDAADGKTFLYARASLIGLRPSLSDEAAGAGDAR